jgi:hypothetical protein
LWFDVDHKTGRGGNDWSLDDPATLAAFRAAASG